MFTVKSSQLYRSTSYSSLLNKVTLIYFTLINIVKKSTWVGLWAEFTEHAKEKHNNIVMMNDVSNYFFFLIKKNTKGQPTVANLFGCDHSSICPLKLLWMGIDSKNCLCEWFSIVESPTYTLTHTHPYENFLETTEPPTLVVVPNYFESSH